MIFKSSKLVYDAKAQKYTCPVCVLDTETQGVEYTDAATMEKHEIHFHTDYVKYHLDYVAEADPERLQRLVNSGEIWDYLVKLEERCSDAVGKQVELWKQQDSEYKAAVMDGDVKRSSGLLNNLRIRAKALVMDAIVRA